MHQRERGRSLVVLGILIVWMFLAQNALADVVRPPEGPPKSPKQELGDLIFNDTNLSNPPGVSCATCHDPFIFWADPRRTPTSAGNLGISGTRNASQMTYSAFSPFFHLDPNRGYVGGQFWDGRSANLVAQVKEPFLNPIEMNATRGYVVKQIRQAPYAKRFKEVYGPTSLDNMTAAYDLVADALAAYVDQAEFFNFKSKYDYYLQGLVQLTPREQRGLNLFNGKGKCASCHPSTAAPGERVLFTDFTYHNLGLPVNPPVAAPTPDLGLGAVVNDAAQNGKFKVPTLRNIQFTRPYGHNGLFRSMEDMVTFINTRDVQVPANVPEVVENVSPDVGDLGLSPTEVSEVVAFLKCLADGYVFVSPMPAGAQTAAQ